MAIWIKFTVLIQLLQMNTKFSISEYWGIKKMKSVMFKIFPFVLPFINRGSFGGPLKLIVSKIIENWWGFEHPSISWHKIYHLKCHKSWQPGYQKNHLKNLIPKNKQKQIFFKSNLLRFVFLDTVLITRCFICYHKQRWCKRLETFNISILLVLTAS